MERRDENPCARTSRVAAEDNRELNCFWSGNSVCSLQYVAGKGAPLFIESNAKFACTVEREPPPSQLSTISPEEHAKTTPFLRMRFCLCITVISRRFFSIARNLDLTSPNLHSVLSDGYQRGSPPFFDSVPTNWKISN